MSSSMVGRSLGQYKIIGVLGSGGMAYVYLGYQPTIDRQVAIKVLPPHPGLDADFRERFQLEARTIGNLQNPGILPLYDYGVQDDILYLVMAYAEGGTLADVIDNGPMDVREIERLLRVLAAALDYAHREGVIHRDVKPANILMQEGHPLLADFGMVKMLAQNSTITGTAIVGTPAYMPPEQGRGDPIDARADVYSLGVIVYEMLTGQQPYRSASPMQMIFQHMNDPIPSVLDVRPDLPEAVQAVIEKAMAKMPDDRYRTAGDFAQAFSRAIHQGDTEFLSAQDNLPLGTPTQATQTLAQETINAAAPSQTSQTIIVRERNSPILMIFAAFGLVTLGIVIAVLIFVRNRPEPSQVLDTIATVRSDITAVAATLPPAAPNVATFGDVRFRTLADPETDSEVWGNAISVRLDGVVPPPEDAVYMAWLHNTETDESLLVGEILVDRIDGRGDLLPTLLDDNRLILPAFYNAVLITQEPTDSTPAAPSATVAYSASVPEAAMLAMREFFVLATGESVIRVDDGERVAISLWDAAKAEARFAAQHAGLAARSTNIGGGRSHAEHTINILLGEFEDYNGNRPENPGRRIGLVPQLDAMETLLEEATTHSDASIELQTNAEFLRVCVQNVRRWAEEIVRLERNLFTAETLEAVQEELITSEALAKQLTTGIDANESGTIDPFEGECGLDQIPEFALQFSSMDLVEGGLDAVEADSAE